MNKHELDTPVAIIDLDIMEKNILDMANFTKSVGVRLRPHVKTHKVPEITRKQLDAGAEGITCAKVGEAEVMAEIPGVKDIFVANQIVGEDKIRRLLNLAEKLKTSVGIDSVEVGKPISAAAMRRGLRLPVLIKIDVGLERTGVLYGKPALDLARKIKDMPGLELAGIYTHEGHVYGATSPENLRDLALGSGKQMVLTANMLRESGIEVGVVSVGATPSARITCTIPGITESRPGTYIFNDHMQIKLGSAKEENCAMTILATIISVPGRDRAVIDAGTKSFGSDKSAAYGAYGLVKDMSDVILERAYEEHGVLKFDSSKRKFKVGDKLEIIPNHVCPAVNLFDELIGVRNDRVETTGRLR